MQQERAYIMNKSIIGLCLVFLCMTNMHAAVRDINITLRNHLETSKASISLLVMPVDSTEVGSFIDPLFSLVLKKKVVDVAEDQRTISLVEGQQVVAIFTLYYTGQNGRRCDKQVLVSDLSDDQLAGIEVDIQLAVVGEVEMSVERIMD